MSTDLFNARPDDPVGLAACVIIVTAQDPLAASASLFEERTHIRVERVTGMRAG